MAQSPTVRAVVESKALRARGDYTIVVVADTESADVQALADYICDGTDDDIQINAALLDVGSTTVDRGGNGGTVILIGREFTITNPILVPTQTRLTSAYGQYGTVIRAASGIPTGAQAGMVELYDSNTQYAEVDSFTLNGASQNVCGVYIYEGTGQEWDAAILAHDLYIINVGNTGLRTENASGGRLRGGRYSNIRIINPGVYGVWVDSPDSFYHHIDVGSAGSHGFYVDHSNNFFSECKAWFSDGDGFVTTSSGPRNSFSACQAQDNQGHGFNIGGYMNTFSSCQADSNSWNTGNTEQGVSDGFHITGNGNAFSACTAYDKNESSRGLAQRYGFWFASSINVAAVGCGTWQNQTGSYLNNGVSGDSTISIFDR